MILTVTMNPAIDVFYPLGEFKLDTVNRISDVSKTAGGKGLNVTRVLSEIGEEVTATGLVGGTNGLYLVQHLPEPVIPSFYDIAGDTRICIAILHDNQQTEILEGGPRISESESEGFLNHFKELIGKTDIVSISGSLPMGMPVDYYTQLIKIAREHDKKVVLDCSGKSLEAVLKSNFKPAAIKPNLEELAQLLNKEKIESPNELKNIISHPLFEGVEWIVVSLGKDGAFAKHNDKFYKVDIPVIQIQNAVGSGDSTVAGIASALRAQKSDEDLLKHAMVLGMLNAQEKVTGHVNMDHYEDLFKQITVKEV